MKFLAVITLLLFGGQLAYGQAGSKKPTPQSTSDKKTEVSADKQFDEYCLKNALQLITVPAGKSDNLKIAGDVTLLDNPNATYRDYGIVLKENETQYYRIAGSSQLLMVNSTYRLRVAYDAGQH
jgi:hypothetical protein